MSSRAVERVVTRSEKVGRLSGTSTQQSLIVEYLKQFYVSCKFKELFVITIQWNPSNKDTLIN